MALSSKSLFLGVYASGTSIRLLFLPLCYLFLSSPFLVLVARFYKLDKKILEHVPEVYKRSDTYPQVFAALATVALFTRLLTGTKIGSGGSSYGGKRRVQLLPYWVLRLRHWGNVVFGGESWLKGVRDSAVTDVIAYHSAGAKHNVIFSPSLLDQIVGNSDSLEEADLTKVFTMQNAFGLSGGSKDQYLRIRPEVTKLLEYDVFKGRGLKSITAAALKILAESLPDFVTFNSSIVDQLPWERVAGIELTDGTDEVEADLFALINEYFCNVILSPITGPHFPESYQLLGTDLATLNRSFYQLALGYPRLTPVPGLPSAKLARVRLLSNFTRLFRELNRSSSTKDVSDNGSQSGAEETDAETSTPLTALNDLFNKQKLPIPARASITLEVINRLVSQVVPLAFWTTYHIFSSAPSNPVDTIRTETQTWAKAVQPPAIHPLFPSPPQVTFTAPNSLFAPNKFPALRSAIAESRRLYSAPITLAKITKPILFTDSSTRSDKDNDKWQLDSGSYLDVGLSQRLANTSPTNYIDPETWKHDRFAYTQPPAPLASTLFDDSDDLVSGLLVAFLAGMTQLWIIAPAAEKTFFEHLQEAQAAASMQAASEPSTRVRKEGVWKMPKTVVGAGFVVPGGEVRVRIRRREGLERVGVPGQEKGKR
ncbi:hypothetical protein B0J11DRAFT_436784 [Dendryphion nanum]|uniref:Cytochrome P450 n=1 Tax=Dendryphion nanum TaxID=256645 RepID=A0A9P9DNI7_9PLEO|nr:hypothetical protein B0J11DRAFT_436784 [Dendryphion nanum]